MALANEARNIARTAMAPDAMETGLHPKRLHKTPEIIAARKKLLHDSNIPKMYIYMVAQKNGQPMWTKFDQI